MLFCSFFWRVSVYASLSSEVFCIEVKRLAHLDIAWLSSALRMNQISGLLCESNVTIPGISCLLTDNGTAIKFCRLA